VCSQSGFVELVERQGEVIDVAPLVRGALAARLAEWRVERHQVDQPAARAQLDQADGVAASFYRAAEDSPVEAQ